MNVVTVQPPAPPLPPPTYTIEGLTRAEVEILAVLLAKVGGSTSGPRGAMDRLARELVRAGVSWESATDRYPHTGSVFFS